MEFIKKLVYKNKQSKETFWAALAKAISVLAGLIIIVLVPKFAGVEAYGTFVLLLAYQSILGLFSGNSIQIAIKKEISEHKFSRISESFLLEGIKLKIFLSIIVSLVFLLIIYLINIDFVKEYFLLLIILVFVMNFWGAIIATFEASHRLFFEAIMYVVEYTIKLLIILIFINHLSVNILLLAFILGYFAASLVGVIILFKQFRSSFKFISFFSFEKRISKVIISRAFFLALVSVSAIILNKIDVIMISFLLDVESVGHYSIAADIMGNAVILSAPIILGVAPLFIEKDIKSLTLKTVKKLILINISIFLFVLLFSDFFVNLIYGPDFQIVSKLLKVFAIFPLLVSLQDFLQQVLVLKDKTKQIFIFGLSIAILNIVLNYFFIISFGIFGAAIATILSYGVWISLQYFFLKKYFFKI